MNTRKRNSKSCSSRDALGKDVLGFLIFDPVRNLRPRRSPTMYGHPSTHRRSGGQHKATPTSKKSKIAKITGIHCAYQESGVFPRSSRQRIFLENRQPPRLRARRCKRSRGTNSAPKSADEGFSNGCARSQKVPPPRRSPKHRYPSCSLLANGASARAAPRTLG